MINFFVKVGFINLLIMFMFSFLEPLHRMYLRDYKGSSIVMLTNIDGMTGGTGFGVEHEGEKYILTNAHVCQLDKLVPHGLYVNLADGRKVKAKILRVYKDHDLCLIRHVYGLNTLSLGETPSMGEMLHAVGYPSLQPKTLTSGEFVGYGTVFVAIEQAMFQDEFVDCRPTDIVQRAFGSVVCVRKFYASLTTIPILGGSSGSPILNSYGNVVGVAFAGSPMGNNWAKVVPVDFIKKFLYSYTKGKK